MKSPEQTSKMAEKVTNSDTTKMTNVRIRRFSILDRLFHLFLMVTFLIQSATGFSRLFITTRWGKFLTELFGGIEATLNIHKTAGVVMMVGFAIHTVYLLTRVNWKDLPKSIFGPDSLVPNLDDAKNFFQGLRWFLGSGSKPTFDRWTYWEKFDYWAVYWGLPLLAVTGIMLMYPVQTARILPGWALNIAVLLHGAEAILAASYIFIVHFFIGHLRPTSFPMNEAMFAGSVPFEEALEEKPAWVERLKQEGKLELVKTDPPTRWYRLIYYVFGYAAVATGIYILINGIMYSRSVNLH